MTNRRYRNPRFVEYDILDTILYFIGNRRKRSRIRLSATDVTAIGDKGHSNNSADANLLESMKMSSALYLIEQKRLPATRA